MTFCFMPKYRRTDRINELLREEIAVLVRDEVRDPRVGLVTITAVQTSPELDHAKVFVRMLGTEEEQEAALEGLHSAAPFVRTQLSRRLHMRRVPELHFQYDRMLDEAARIEQLLREALPDGAYDVRETDDGDEAGDEGVTKE
jgi:ribosome-binding factor A